MLPVFAVSLVLVVHPCNVINTVNRNTVWGNPQLVVQAPLSGFSDPQSACFFLLARKVGQWVTAAGVGIMIRIRDLKHPFCIAGTGNCLNFIPFRMLASAAANLRFG